jgi:hypothetical protein
MAIYNPPKSNNWGSVLQVAGATTAAIGGVVGATGVGLAYGAAIAGVGAIMSGVGSAISKNDRIKQQQYDMNYKARVQSDNALQSSISNIKKMANINL